MGIQCPSCHKPLKAVFYEGNSVRLCFQCKGMFLNKKKLQNIEESREIDIPTDQPTPSRKHEVGRLCPECQISMKKVKKGRIRTTIIDVCEKCSGIWLDKGELESIQADYEACENNIASNNSRATKTKKFHCPKCQHQQVKSIQCTKCGIVFEKYEISQNLKIKEQQQQNKFNDTLDDIYSDLKGYDFKQTPSYVETLIGYETRNEYTINLTGTNYTWVARETRGLTTALLRNIFGGLFPYTLEVYDHNRNLIFKFKERKRLFFSRTDVYDNHGKSLGYIQRALSLLRRKVTIHNARGLRTHILSTKIANPHSFTITRNKRKCGTINKKWNGIAKEYMTDADNFSLRFSKATDKPSKMLYLAAAYLIDKTYFEGGDDQRSYGQVLGIPFLDSIYATVIFAALFFGAIYFFTDNDNFSASSIPIPEQTAVERKGTGIKTYEFKNLLEQNRPLSKLAKQKYFTVVEVYLDSCLICKKLETGFKPFLAKRKDVLIRKVHVPENMNLSFTANSQEELNKLIEEMNAREKSYQICGTPHIEVYNQNKQLIVADNCSSKKATSFLKKWIKKETGIKI